MRVKEINQLFAEYGARIPVLSAIPQTLPKGAKVIVMENGIPKLYIGSETNVPVSPESGKEFILPEPHIRTVMPLTAETGDSIEFMGRTYGVVQSLTGRLWLDRNLGASRRATSWDDIDAYGDYYQWGRSADGHQLRQSATRTDRSGSSNAGHSDMIVGAFQWLLENDQGLWNANTRSNLPAPSGWHVPTTQEWMQEVSTWPFNDDVNAFESVLKIPVAGYRHENVGELMQVGSEGHYWTATSVGNGSHADSFAFRNQDSGFPGNNASHVTMRALSVRLIKDE